MDVTQSFMASCSVLQFNSQAEGFERSLSMFCGMYFALETKVSIRDGVEDVILEESSIFSLIKFCEENEWTRLALKEKINVVLIHRMLDTSRATD